MRLDKAVYDLGDDWTMFLTEETGSLPRIRLSWYGEDPCMELEIPPDMDEETLITKGRELSLIYTMGYNRGADDDRREVISMLKEGLDP